jgi:lipopolysaccharide biosynthesis regulator YciM
MTNEKAIEWLKEGYPTENWKNSDVIEWHKAIELATDALHCLSADHSVYGIVLQYGYDSARKDVNRILSDKNLETADKFSEICTWASNVTSEVLLEDRDAPKPPIQDTVARCGMGEKYYDWICPTCKSFLAYEPNVKGIPNRCNNCGQLIDKEGVTL